MAELKFIINLSSKPYNLIKLATDYENLPTYLPSQLREVKILEKNPDEIITKEIFEFRSIFNKKIEMMSKHKQISASKLYTEIISGPAKGSTMTVDYIGIDSGTQVVTEINLKLNIKTRLLMPLIKKTYRTFLMGILYKMNSDALEH